MMMERLADRMESQDHGPRLPKYVRLYNAIHQAIEAGELKPDEQLPTELEMTKRLPTSLGTVQKALRMLSESGLIVRRHGRGTFVASRPSELRNLWHFRFMDDDRAGVVPVFTKVVTIEADRSEGPWASFLEPADFYVRIDRMVDVNHEFNAVSSYFLPGNRYGKLLDSPYSSLDGIHARSVMRDQFGVPLLRVRAQTCAMTLEPRITRLLRLTTGTVGLVCALEGFSYRDSPASYHLIYAPPNARPLEIRERMPGENG